MHDFYRTIAVEQFGEEWIQRFEGQHEAPTSDLPLFTGVDLLIDGITYCDSGHCGM